MKPLRLYMENFVCHEQSFIDITQFSSALIVAKIAGNEEKSNGGGKTTIFKAIEYVLFNQADVNLEALIRDDTSACTVTIDIDLNGQQYRISRTRTRKGSSDLTLYQRTSETGAPEEVYGVDAPISEKKFWKDISGRRSADTEKELAKLIKLNFKAFRNTIHFLQNDFSGLTTATPEKRKGILKEALSLAVYSKLEKIAKEEYNALTKQIDKDNILLETLGAPQSDIINLKKQSDIASAKLFSKTSEMDAIKDHLKVIQRDLNELMNNYSLLSGKNVDLKSKEKEFLSTKNKLEISIKEYTSKKSNISKAARVLVDEIKELKEKQLDLISLDFSQIEIMSEKMAESKQKMAHHDVAIKNNRDKLEELKIPMPDNADCKHCRQSLSKEHKKNCQDQIDKEISECQNAITNHKKSSTEESAAISSLQREINSLLQSKQKLESVNQQISNKNKELQDKKDIYEEYNVLLQKFTKELSEKISELDQIAIDLKNSSIEEEIKIKKLIDEKKSEISIVNENINVLNKELVSLSSEIAVINHSIENKEKDLVKKTEIHKSLKDLNTQIDLYPSILQAFSSSGIPNLIIQNVLDDLQVEANNLLSKLRPELQLSFVVEKTKGDGTQDDTLDILYFSNGKQRDYEQLSGAMKLAVTFSLKLGLSFLLQNMIGTDIKFLLLDEIDQSLDKASVDAFADIVKFFQKDFTILIITHNDRLKDKFSHAILVNQDINGVSNAKVVSSW